MLCAIAGNPAGKYLSTLRREIPQCVTVFVINYYTAVGTESADFPPVKGPLTFGFICRYRHCHPLQYYLFLRQPDRPLQKPESEDSLEHVVFEGPSSRS